MAPWRGNVSSSYASRPSHPTVVRKNRGVHPPHIGATERRDSTHAVLHAVEFFLRGLRRPWQRAPWMYR